MDEITPQTIANAVAAAYDVDAADLVAMRQDPRLVWPRDVAIWIMHRLTGQTPGQIGLAFGGRDGVAVQVSIDRVNRRAAGQQIAAELQSILNVAAAAGAARRLTGRATRLRRPAEAIARQVAACRGADGVSADDVRTLAAAVLTERLSEETRALVEAALDVTSYTPATPGAPAPDLETALSNLALAAGAYQAAGGREAARHE